MRSLFTLFVVHALACLPAIAQTKQVLKTISTNGLTESLVVPSGQTLTIASGGTLTAAAGSTITGIGSGLTIGSSTITSGTSGRALYNNSGVLGELDLASLYQPLATNLTSIGALANSAGVLTNNGGGTFSYTSTSTGGNAEVDAGKVVTFNTTGGIRLSDGATGSGLIVVGSSLLPPYIGIKSTEIRATLDLTKSVRFEFATPSGTGVQARVVTVPATTGTLITTGDTGTITSTMILDGTIATADLADSAITNAKLAGSIALSKLAITGTPDGTKFIRDDGSYQAINLSGYLPLTGGTLTGALTLTGGTVTASTPMLTQTQTWNAVGTTFRGVEIAHTVTGAAAASTHLRILGGASATSERLSLTEEKLTVTSGNASGNAMNLVSQYGTSTFVVGGGGALTINNCATIVPTSGEFRASLPGNGSFFCGIGFEQTPNVAYIRPFGTGATTLQIGVSAASPVSHLIRGASARAGTDSNASGAALGMAGGMSTGTGNGGDFYTGTYMTGSSGSTANTLQTRTHTIARFVNLTEGTATNVASISLPSGKVTGGTATLTVWASDGTDHQALTSQVRFDAVNKAGTITATVTQTDNTTAASTGTLTVTYDATASGNNVLLRANATSSLTQTTLRARLVITALNGDDVQTVTPQ